jgi:hypothetical protein
VMFILGSRELLHYASDSFVEMQVAFLVTEFAAGSRISGDASPFRARPRTSLDGAALLHRDYLAGSASCFGAKRWTAKAPSHVAEPVEAQ